MSLFSGTIRSNLDPFGEHSDTECRAVLARCHLAGALAARGLDTPISQTGALSAGERQLVLQLLYRHGADVETVRA